MYAAVQAAFYGIENYPKVAERYPFIGGVDNNNEMTVSYHHGNCHKNFCPTKNLF